MGGIATNTKIQFIEPFIEDILIKDLIKSFTIVKFLNIPDLMIKYESPLYAHSKRVVVPVRTLLFWWQIFDHCKHFLFLRTNLLSEKTFLEHLISNKTLLR